MQVSLHTRKETNPSIEVDFNHTTDWNPWLQIKLVERDDCVRLPQDVTLHIDGLSIIAANEFIDGLESAVADLRIWNDRRKEADNEDVES